MSRKVNSELVSFSFNNSLSKSTSYSSIPPLEGGSKKEDDQVSNRDVYLEEKKKYFGFTRRQWLAISVFCFSDLCSSMSISLQAPFFPAEAERKGASPSEYGFIFGVFELTAFCVSPIYGMFIDKIGAKTLFKFGIAVAGIGNILFGFLDTFESKDLFVGFAFACRIFEAIGASGFFTASFAIIAMEFPDSVATTFSFLETFFGLGMIAGPVIGGALFEIGGFTLPFAILGSCLFASGIFANFVMPQNESTPVVLEENGKKYSGFRMFAILKIPDVALAGASTATMSLSFGFIAATLEPHVRQFNLSPFHTGLIFILNGGMYALSVPIWGKICDNRKVKTKYITLAGSLLIISGFSLMGPLPFLPIQTNLWLVCIGLSLQGIGFGATLPAAFVEALRGSLANGFPDSVSTYGIISGLWTSMFAIGNFVGPSVGGVLFDEVGFRVGSLFVIGIQLILSLIVISFLIFGRNPSPLLTDDDADRLLLLAEATGKGYGT